MNKKYIRALKKNVDKHIKSIEENSKDIEYVLSQLGQLDKDTITDKDKEDLDKLIQQINNIDKIINKVIGENTW